MTAAELVVGVGAAGGWMYLAFTIPNMVRQFVAAYRAEYARRRALEVERSMQHTFEGNQDALRWAYAQTPPERIAFHCESCGIGPDDDQKRAIFEDPALHQAAQAPGVLWVNWYCPRCARAGSVTASGLHVFRTDVAPAP